MIDKATDLELSDDTEWEEVHDKSIERYLEGGADSSNAEEITLALFGRYEKTKDPALLAAAWMLGRCVDAARGEGDTAARKTAVWNVLGLTGIKSSIASRNVLIAHTIERLKSQGLTREKAVARVAQEVNLSEAAIAKIHSQSRGLDAAPQYCLLPTWTVPQLLEAIQIK